MNKYFKSFGLYAIVFLIILAVVAYTGPGMMGQNTQTTAAEAYDYSDLMKELSQDHVASVEIARSTEVSDYGTAEATLKNGKIITVNVPSMSTLTEKLNEYSVNNGVKVTVAELQREIDPESRGEGYGIAPIGHRVTVEGVTEVACDIQMTISLAEGAVQETVVSDIRKQFEAYLEEMRKSWADSAYLTVRISYLESRALEADGVLDISGCTINGTGGNLVLGANEVPVLGEIGVSV
mgnify:CR=1 FL=1